MQEVVRAAGLVGFRRLVRELGGNPASILGRIGLTDDHLSDPDRYIPYRNVLLAIEAAARELRVPDFGMRLAAKQDLAFLGAISLTIQSARTVRDGLTAAGRNIHYHTPAVAITLDHPDRHGNEPVRLAFLMHDLPEIPQATEHAVAHLCKIVTLLSDGSASPVDIHFRHRQVGADQAYQKHLRKVPQFQSHFDGITMRSSDARRPLAHTNKLLQSFVERFVIGLAPTFDVGIDEQVRTVLHNLIRTQDVRLQDVARILRLHPRTLQRRLEDAGTRFEQLHDEVRRHLAGQLLSQGNVPLAQVARIVGFGDQPALNRACRRWFGTTPGVMRTQAARLRN